MLYTGSCSGVQSKTKRTCRVLNGVFRSRESALLAARLLCGEQLRVSGKDGHMGKVGEQSSKEGCHKHVQV